SKKHRRSDAYQRFVRQLYHACLARVFEPSKAGMTTPEVVKCPDGHYRRAIYGLGPYIADYPEQVWLAAIVQNWCPKCDANPHHLDSPGARRRSHEKTDFLIPCFNPGTLWDDFGIRADVVPFTHGFPRADIHELLSPDLLHQVIKGTFKDHLVEWVNQYLHTKYGEARALEIIADIDHRTSAVASFPGLRRFPDDRDFSQWTGDDSKALMKVYIGAIAGHLKEALERFHTHRDIFIQTGVHFGISLPRQHSLVHYLSSIRLFGSLNGLCSSITESKHIKASSRYKALMQMLSTICRLERLAAARILFRSQGMMEGTALSYAEDEDDDGGDAPGPKALSSIELAGTPQRNYLRRLAVLATHIDQPQFPDLFRRFLYDELHPDSDTPSADISIHHYPNSSVTYMSTTPLTPSDLCGVGGMSRERIRTNPNWHGAYPRHDTVFIETDSERPGMEGMVIGRTYLCALVHWFSLHGDEPDPDTGMWVVTPEIEDAGVKSLAIVNLDCIARAAHLLPRAANPLLLPVYGSAMLPEDFHFSHSLDAFRAFFVNRYTVHHTFKF
ncbi:hypothetical protein DFH09DRAFT_1167844, partial [Mycena vulgaris]